MGTAYKAVSEDYPTEKFAVKLLPHGKKTDPILIETLANEAGMIYSLGMTMYYALTGRTFFDGDNHVRELVEMYAFRDRASNRLGKLDNVSDGLKSIIQRMIQRTPRDRYPTRDKLEEDLATCF